MELVLPYLHWIPFALAIMVVVIVFLTISTGLRFRNAFQAACDELGLHWESTGLFSPGTCTGVVDGETVEIFLDRQGVGSFERMLTVVEVHLNPPIAGEFDLRRESIFERLSHTLGVHDYEFDDPAFDKMYKVSGQDPELLGRVFNSDARAALVLMSKGSTDLRVTPTRVRWEFSGRVLAGTKLVRVARAGLAAAQAMRGR